MHEPSQINGSPHYIDLTEADSYKLKLNGYKSLLEQCRKSCRGVVVLPELSLLTDRNTVQQNLPRKISYLEESVLCHDSFLLSLKESHGVSM